MKEAADNGDGIGFYDALFKFTVVSLDEANNSVLSGILTELLPNVRRMQYLSILLKTDRLKESVAFFSVVTECLQSRDIEKGVSAIHDYVMSEKEFVLSVIDDSQYTQYIEG